MKRIRIVGLCLVAVFALSALVASSASAALPEFKVCGKAAKAGKPAKYLGKYTNKECSKEASPAEITEGKKNKYEREEWTKAKKTTFKGKNVDGTPHNNIVDPFGVNSVKGEPAQVKGTTTCTSEKVTGKVTGPKTETWSTEYKGCEALSTPCNTKGDKPGVIKTEVLEGTLVYINVAGKVPGLRVKGLGAGGLLAQYECLSGGLNVLVHGEIIAKPQGNTNSANKHVKTVAEEGPLKMQSNMYENEAFTEAQGKEYFEWGFELEACLKGEAPFPPVPPAKTVAECEVFIGPAPAAPATSLISTVSGAQNATAPAVQNGTSESTGEAFLIEA
jgi:hypothetical protein